MTRVLQVGYWLSLLVTFSWAQTECARIFHSAVINNDTVWISGGDLHVSYPNGTIRTNSVRDLQTIDLTQSWENSDDDLFNHISKPWNSSHPAAYPPWLDEGASWSDGKNLYLYGGFVSQWQGPPVPPLGTWRYDIAANNWTSEGFSGVPLNRLSQGAVMQSNVDKKAYYLSGSLVPGGNPTFDKTPGADVYMDPGLISLDMGTRVWSNYSTSDMNEWGTIGDGYAGLIETVGDQGLIVAFGGYTYPVGQKLSYLAGRQTNTSNQNSMEDVRVYDIAKQQWYTQKTSGDVPKWRMAGCAVVAAAPDLSSYSIYVFGGMAPTTEESDGNVYILSVPSFHWIRATDDNTIRIHHQCMVAQNHTMLVVGGITPVTNNELVPEKRNCDSSTFANGVAIFDMRSLSWNTYYNASDNGQYTVPAKVYGVIGGNETGGATLNTPSQGFNSSKLEDLFKTRTTRPTSTSTPTPSPSSTPSAKNKDTLTGGAIAGATVGSVAGVAMIGSLLYFMIRRQRKQQQEQVEKQEHAGQLDMAAPWEGATLQHRKQIQSWPREIQGEETAVMYELGTNYSAWNVSRAEMPTEANERAEMEADEQGGEGFWDHNHSHNHDDQDLGIWGRRGRNARARSRSPRGGFI